MKKWLAVLIPLALAVVVINDVGRYLTTTYDLSNVTREAATMAARVAHDSNDRTLSWQAAEAYAQHKSATIYGYDLNGVQVHVWTKQRVDGTWVLSKLNALLDHQPMETPMYVDDEDTAMLR